MSALPISAMPISATSLVATTASAKYTVLISHSVLPVRTEKKFDSSMTLGKLKEKLYSFVGTNPANMLLQAQTKQGQPLALLEGDEHTLGSFALADPIYLHIIDRNPTVSGTAALLDVSKVEKYTMSDAKYNERQDTVRKFKQSQLKQMKKNGDLKEEPKLKPEVDLEQENKRAESFKVSHRCEVDFNTPQAMRGQVMFIGPVDFDSGSWVGIKLDEPVGENDGTVKGKRYFPCTAKYGIMVRPSRVQVGDFPELGIDCADDNEDENIFEEI